GWGVRRHGWVLRGTLPADTLRHRRGNLPSEDGKSERKRPRQAPRSGHAPGTPPMRGALPHRLRRLGLDLADRLVTLPLLRWTWRGQADALYTGDLPDFRPTDPEAVREMMAGRYLLASKLVETGGVSPFGVDVDHPDW